MIQRIQTVYLLLVAGLFIALMFLPLADVRSGDMVFSFDIAGLNTLTEPSVLTSSTWPLIVLVAIMALLSLVAVFMYKKRILQIRICVFNSLLTIGFCILFGLYLWRFAKSPDLPDFKVSMQVWAAFPIISLILNYLAIRKIGSDEALVRSLDRLR